MAQRPFQDYYNAAHAHQYWLTVVECDTENKGKGCAGGCGHLVTKRIVVDESLTSHCTVWRLSWKDIRHQWEEYVNASEMKKCTD
ncbi:hypothetical protein N473_20305 [Pseudoalteromonas luteoviolacea CPMOR-1]|uniref:Uncharacterized protein n=1 Tax=Pseudoalteromonas luteoviolacea CPMOR-1 TaxID=1365248 RepID=A0A167JZE9_9GAMM|nr:hypothetical protein [Pseudoalteromonas luteoviolacea]KZN61886.1 hypothetical protein N473_20305 [Pseudoalteromonas luteoviolacea CPMOR-1]